MAQLSKTDQRRISFLSLISSAATLATAVEVDPYEQANTWLNLMERDDFFGVETSSPTPKPTSRRRESPSRRSSGGNGGYRIKDPDAPATKSQIGKLLSLTDEYSWEEAEQFTKGDISNLIEDLV